MLISAGFDAHSRDPLASCICSTNDYIWVTGKLREFAREYAGGRIVSTLEGGYDIARLAPVRGACTGIDGGVIRPASAVG